MKLLILMILLLPGLLMAEEDKSDDHNTLPLGFLTRDSILSGLEVFNRHYVDYVPKSDPILAIHNVAVPCEIKVVFGDWCKDSKKHVPAFIKTMDVADNKNLMITYINVDRQKKEPVDLLAGLNIESVPTIIVYNGGQEIGRMVETPKVSVDEDLAGILSQTSH